MIDNKQKLTQAQMRVLRTIVYGHALSQRDGAAVYSNDRKICNLDTINAMLHKGVLTGTWKLTPLGVEIAKELFPSMIANIK